MIRAGLCALAAIVLAPFVVACWIVLFWAGRPIESGK